MHRWGTAALYETRPIVLGASIRVSLENNDKKKIKKKMQNYKYKLEMLYHICHL